MPFRSLQLPVFWDPDLERPRPESPPSILVAVKLGLAPTVTDLQHSRGWGDRAPKLPILLSAWSRTAGVVPPRGGGGPELQGSSEYEQCLLLPVWPQPAPPKLLGAGCCPWLQGLINSGPRCFEITG